MSWIRITVRVICAIAIVLGIFYRVHNIDRKVYGVDETVTSLRVAGATLPEFKRDLGSGTLHSLEAVRERYQLRQSNSSIMTTVESLELDDPQHPPLYFILQRAWQTFGTSIMEWRSLSVVFGLALLLAVFGFAAELFDRDTGIVSTALVAVSPFHQAYAQYNREYALWALMTAISSAVVLLSLRRRNVTCWIAYGTTVALGLYTDPLFLTVAVAHAIYVSTLYGSRKLSARTGICFAAALISALAAYVPWLVVLWMQRRVMETTTQWYAAALPAKLLAAKWFFEVAAVFYDAEYGNLRLSAFAVIVVSIALGLVFIGLRSTSRRQAAFIAFLVGASAGPLIIADLILHQSRSTAGRYLSPAWVGLEVAVAVGIMVLIGNGRPVFRAAGVALLAVLISGGSTSLASSSSLTSWWIDSHDGPLVSVMGELSAKSRPVLCYVDDYESVLILSDSVTRGIGLSKSYEPGCFAIATASEVKAIALARGTFSKVSDLASMDDGLNELHAQTGRAHRIAFEEVNLWQLR